MPNGGRLDILRGHSAGRQQVKTTDRDLQLGPGPERVDRILNANNQGITGDGTSSFPGTWDQIRIGHVPLARPSGKSRIAVRLVADGAIIPAIYAGNPVK
jgi:hypothetical protein